MPSDLHAMLDRFLDQFADALIARAQQKAGALGVRAGSRTVSGKIDRRRAGSRLCPVPGCGKPGAGPRNRWFCKDHAKSLPVSEQRRLLAAAREDSSSLVRSAPAAKGRGRGRSKLAGRKLDMSCRVAGCKNVSRGPRFGFICDKHRKELSSKQQQEAREKWKEQHNKAA